MNPCFKCFLRKKRRSFPPSERKVAVLLYFPGRGAVNGVSASTTAEPAGGPAWVGAYRVRPGFMRKLVCRFGQNVRVRQSRHLPMTPLNASSSWSSCCIGHMAQAGTDQHQSSVAIRACNAEETLSSRGARLAYLTPALCGGGRRQFSASGKPQFTENPRVDSTR